MNMPEIITLIEKNPETVRNAVQSLVKKGHLKKNGTTKGTFYNLNK